MTQERLSMRKIREVLRLKFESGLSHRAIARSCAISHSTVREYIHRARTAGLSWPLPEGLDEDQLDRLPRNLHLGFLFPTPPSPSGRTIPACPGGQAREPDWKAIHTELRRKGVTLRLLWLEYRRTRPDGYGYSWFCECYRLWAKTLNPPMRLTHKAGEKLFVDYAGQTLPVVDLPTGEIRQAHIFVAVLGASSYTYAEAHLAEDLPNWIGGHVRSLAFFGGVPEIIVPDNTTTGVKHPSRYEPDLNPTYLDMAEHYRTVVIPARVGKPKDKAKVEVGVQVVEPRVRVPGERWILACLRDRTFFGLVDLNRSIHELLEDLNNRVMRHLGQSRRELFEALDRPALKPLPAAAYEFAVWKKARVNIDYHVEFDHHYYSVPYRLIKQEVFLRVSENTLEIFHKHQRVASHPRSRVPGRYSTLLDHMPPAHRHYGEWSPERFLKWAEQIGPQTRRLIETILGSRIPPQQGYRSCLGILSLAKRHTQERLEAACARALPANIHTYKGVKNILEAHLDQLPLEETVSIPLKTHANIRGSSYASGRVAGYYR